MGYLLDRATTNDIAELIELRMAYLQADFGDIDQDVLQTIRESLPAFFARHLGNDLHAFVMRDEQDGIVSVALMLESEKPANPRFPHGRIGTVFNVYTSPAHRRRGLARQVMEELIAEAHNRSLDLVELNATNEGYSLYKSIGFTDANLHRPLHIRP